MAGVEGFLVRERDLFRVVVSIELLQRSVAVEIDREMLAPCEPAPRPSVTFPELVRMMVNADMQEIETRLRGGAAALSPEPTFA